MMRHLHFDIDSLFTATGNSETVKRVSGQSRDKRFVTVADRQYTDWLLEMKSVEYFDIKFDVEKIGVTLSEDVTAFTERLTYILDNYREGRFSGTVFYFDKNSGEPFTDSLIQERYNSPNTSEERHWQWCASFPSMDAFFRFILAVFRLMLYMNGNLYGLDILKNCWLLSFFPLTTAPDPTRINFDEFLYTLDGAISNDKIFWRLKRMLEFMKMYTSVTEDDIKDFYNNYHARRKTIHYGRPVLSNRNGNGFGNYRCDG